jgi:hypothetical protein
MHVAEGEVFGVADLGLAGSELPNSHVREVVVGTQCLVVGCLVLFAEVPAARAQTKRAGPARVTCA